MPIRPENRKLYPPDWQAISAGIRERAGHRCEWRDGSMRCCARQYAIGHWAMLNGLWQWNPTGGNGPHDAAGYGLGWPDMQRWTFSEARQFAAELDWSGGEEGRKPIVIVLTVAHLNHQPEDCRPENLAAWCQRHHLAYDHQHHQANARATRLARVGQTELF